MMKQEHHIAILGGTTYDHILYLPSFPQPIPQTIHQLPFAEGTGSTGAGKALALTKLGMPNSLYSVVGDDYYGTQIKAYLASQQVVAIFDTDPAGTERHVNIMDNKGGRISMFITQSSEQINFNESAIKKIVEQATVIVLNIISYCRHLIPLVRAYNKPVWTDLHDYDGNNLYHEDFINAANYIHLSSDNLPNYKQTMEQMIQKGKELVICTHGKQGASLLTKQGEWIEQPIIQDLTLVDSNGAGDSFFAGFLYAYLNNKPLKTCMQYGAVAGGLATMSPNLVFEGLTEDVIEQMIKDYFEK